MAIKFKDYYETLGVPRTASPEEIKKAFRKLARIHHPDTASDKDKAGAEEKFKEINEAYEVLGDTDKRRRFDELGANWQHGGGSGGRAPQGGPFRGFEGADFEGFDSPFEFGGTGYSDFFEAFFSGRGGGFGGGGRRSGPARGYGSQTFAQKGQDVEADIMVTLEEVLTGSQRRITLRRPGENGGADRTDTYQVRIPAGVHEGQLIRLGGQGNPGYNGGATGDLFLRVRLARHPDFSVQDSDLHFDLDLAPWEAVLGVQAEIPTLDGATRLKIPPGTASGSKLRLKGLGLPRESGNRGDLYATVRVQIPTKLSEAEKTAWEALRDVSDFKPRS